MNPRIYDPQPLHVTSEAIDSNASWKIAINAARQSAVVTARGEAQTRRATLDFEGGWMRWMAVDVPSMGVFGYKEFHLARDKSVRYVIHVFETATGRPLGIVDAALVTTLRTAATAAVAVESIVGSGAHVRLGVIGTGAIALTGVEALNEVVHLDRIRVTSRRPENREAFVQQVSDRIGFSATAHETVAEALEGVDLLYVATNSGGQIVLREHDVERIPVIASVGSTLPAQRELDGQILSGADRIIVDTWDVLGESGDALHAASYGLERGRVELLGNVLAEDVRERANQRTVYKSIGSPEQDIVLAAAILNAGVEEGFGRRIDALSAAKVNL